MSAQHRHSKKPHPAKSSASRAGAEGERLQKVLAAAGFGSRRKCEELIQVGRVEVNRRVVTELGTRVDPSRQEIRVDGAPLSQVRRAYYAVYKPPGVVSTSRDPSGRPCVVDLIPSSHQRLFAVGRLDLHSEGLILLTNDGELAHRLTHPRFGVRKVYRVLVAGHPTREILDGLREGIHLFEGLARVAEVRIKRRQKQSTLLEMVLEEGRNREIRRVLARVGHKVLHLVRIAVGPVRLGKLAPGQYRRLSRQEIERLLQLVHSPDQKKRIDE
jgi:23S rRNA pseudouridine2605 synthase